VIRNVWWARHVLTSSSVVLVCPYAPYAVRFGADDADVTDDRIPAFSACLKGLAGRFGRGVAEGSLKI
jgi:hypothetical protein